MTVKTYLKFNLTNCSLSFSHEILNESFYDILILGHQRKRDNEDPLKINFKHETFPLSFGLLFALIKVLPCAKKFLGALAGILSS